MADHFFTVAANGQSEFKDRGSRFLGLAFPITSADQFKILLAGIKKEHPKAAHHCFAYRLGTEGLSFRVSDDGEPSGSAGRPMLGQVDSRKLTDTLIIVVRYFGGILLGVPGLINAYKTTASAALDNAGIIEKPVLSNYQLSFDYTKMNEVMQTVKQLDCIILKNEALLFCSLVVAVPRIREQEAVDKWKKIAGVEVKPV